MSRFTIFASLLALVSCGLLMRDVRPLTDAERSWTDTPGELLMAAGNCTACHAAGDAVLDRLAPSVAPNLAGIGWRVSPSWLRNWIESPHALRPDTRMPNVLAGFDAEKRAEIADEITHYLMTLGGGFQGGKLRQESWDVDRGAELFTELGCQACHVDGVDGALSAKTNLPNLAAFLSDPLHTRPSGLMPDMHLSDEESAALASWLLREQFAAGPTEEVTKAGLEVQSYAIPYFPNSMPDWGELVPVAVASAHTIDIAPRTQDEQFGLVFQGELRITEPGEFTFYTESDDGSRLWIDQQLVVDNDGLHGTRRIEDTATLSAGWHALRVEMFEAGGGEALDAGFMDANGQPRPFVVGELRHNSLRFDPIGHEVVEIDAGKARWGKAWFEMMRCSACHELPGMPVRSAPDLFELTDLSAGCLSEQIPARIPDYGFDDAELHALRDVLEHRNSLAAPLQPAERVDRSMQQLGCLSCHSRGSHPGPQGPLRAAFEGTADLGDEGRLPPDLTDVGARLRPDWLREVVEHGTSVRPYMLARMPRFGEQAVAALVEALPAADCAAAAPDANETGHVDAARIAAGRELLGDAGFRCISCHGVAGHEGVGLPGLDLAFTTQRLTREHFENWMMEPLALRAGTRMPTYFDEGQSTIKTILDGDPAAQIDALWAYMSLGNEMPLPPGLVVDRASYDVLPVDRPRIVAVFMKDLSARVLAVGYPERVGAAFDAANVRLGKVWRGDFFNLEGTWRGRAGQLEVPPGDGVHDLPPGPALARADAAAWPDLDARGSGWRMSGQLRDAAGLPSFRYGRDGLQVEETFEPIFDPTAGRLVRHMRLTGPEAEAHVLRAALSSSITEAADGVFHCDNGLAIVVHAGEVTLRTGESGTELLVAPVPAAKDALIIEVEMLW